MANADAARRPQVDNDVAAEKDKPDGNQDEQEQLRRQQDEQDEARWVHEITESSSDESDDEAPPTKATTIETEALEDANQEEKTHPDLAVVKQIRDGAYIPEPEVLYATKNVADMHYLFTNDKLKEQPPALVLRSDPFCIPRVTDNVPNYRPMLNPLSIFMGEEKLLPGNFRLDPSERPPNASAGKVPSKQATVDAPHRRPLPPLPGSSASASSSGPFRGKTSAFMGTMPRQAEFAEIPVSEKLFQNHVLFRPSPPIPRAPSSPSKDRPATSASNMDNRSATSGNSEANGQAPAVGDGSGAANGPVPFSDAMLLSSIQHTLDAGSSAMTPSDTTTSLATDCATSMAGVGPASLGFQIQQLQPLDSVADTLTNYLPTRNMSGAGDNRVLDEHYFDPPTAYSHANVSMGMPTGSGTFHSLLSPAVEAPSLPYGNIFDDDGQHASQGMQTFSSALGSISITTPTNAAAGYPAAITPQGGAVGSSEGTPRLAGLKKPRAKNVFRPCTAPGCTKGARGKSGLCQKHGGGKRCAVTNCPKGAQGSSTMCLFHGGGYRCTVDGCNTGARGTSGLCAKHGGYKKGKTSGGKRGPAADAAAAKRARTNDSQPSPVSAS